MDENVKEDIPMIPLEPSEEIPSIPAIPLEPSEPVYYWIELEERGFVVGYSSSESNFNSIVFNVSDLPKDFESHFSFYKLNEALELVRDETRVNELIKEKEDYDKLPTDKEKIELLEKENESLKLEILETKQRALMTEEAILDLATMIIGV